MKSAWSGLPQASPRSALLGLAAALAGCTPLPPLAPSVPPPAEVVRETPPPEEVPTFQSQPLRHLANRKLAPMPDVPVTAKAKCSFRDPTGYRGQLDLKVNASRVERFTTTITIPKRGECRFDLADFRQTGSGNTVILGRSDSSCIVRIWPQGQQVTVAFHDCPQQCSGDSFDYLWPILVDARHGRCS